MNLKEAIKKKKLDKFIAEHSKGEGDRNRFDAAISSMLGKSKVVAVNKGHVFSDLMPHAPSSLVGDAELSLQFFCRNTAPGLGEKIDGVEPQLKRGTGTFEGGSNARVEMMSAPLAGVSPLRGDAGEAGFFFALRALRLKAVSHLHDVFQATVIVGKLLKKLFDGLRFHRGISLRCPMST